MINKISTYFNSPTSIKPLVIFRMAFGFLMLFSMLRFMNNGWIEEAYVDPTFHFTYQYFNWVRSFDIYTMYAIVAVCALAAMCICLGLFYRIATVVFFLSFTYLELIEKAWYLNHYYAVSLIAFLLIWVPANRAYSIDIILFSKLKKMEVPAWTIIIFKLQLSIVYFYGAIAKLKYDWLIEAQPLKIWLKAKTDLPFIGMFFEHDIAPFIFAWGGFLYDLIIPFLVWNRKTRPVGYVLVLIFHILTHLLFNIGMFPWVMIFGSLIFITEQEWRKVFRLSPKQYSFKISAIHKPKKYLLQYMLMLFFVIQIIVPLRHYLLTDAVLWTERGFRFSWHVMVMEKTGSVKYTINDPKTGKQWVEYPSRRLTEIQETQMSFQPDMIWQYAQYLKEVYSKKGVLNPVITVVSKASLNGRRSQTLVKPDVNLADLEQVDEIYSHIEPLKNQRSFDISLK